MSSSCSAHSWVELNGAELSNESPREALFQPSSPPAMKDREGMCSWAFEPHSCVSVLSQTLSPLGFLCDSAELHLSPTTGHTHSPKHTSFLRVTEWVTNEDTPTIPANQSRTEKIRDGHTAIRPDCYKHFTSRFKTPVLDQVYIFWSIIH